MNAACDILRSSAVADCDFEKASEAVGAKRRPFQFDLSFVRKILLDIFGVTYWVTGQCLGETLWPSRVLEGHRRTSERIGRTEPYRMIALRYCRYVSACV